jgi:hypothetical protein
VPRRNQPFTGVHAEIRGEIREPSNCSGVRLDPLSVSEDTIRTWAPDGFWQLTQPLIPYQLPAAWRRQTRADDRAVLAAIGYLVQAGGSSSPAGVASAGWSDAYAGRDLTWTGSRFRW